MNEIRCSKLQATIKPKGLTCLQVFFFWGGGGGGNQAAYSVQSGLDLKVIELHFSSSSVNTS